MIQPVNSPRILIVEDNPDDVKLAVRSLRKCGVEDEITVAETGIVALSRLLGEDSRWRALPELVLLDLKLPAISGLEVLAQLRKHPRTQNLPVVVVTSSDDKGDLAASHRLGANGYIRKDIDPDKFQESIQRLVDSWLSSPADRPVLLLT